MGQPGVYAAVQASWNPFDDPYTSNTGKALVSNLVSSVTEEGLRAYYRASFHTVIGDPIVETITRGVAKSEFVEKAILSVYGGLSGVGYRFARMTSGLLDRALERNTRYVTEETIIGYNFSYVYDSPTSRVVEKFLSSKLGLPALDLGIGLGIDVGYQFALDFNNPYLSGWQMTERAVFGQGTGSLVSFYIGSVLIGGPVGFIASIVISIGWDIWIAPWIYEKLDAEPTRNLAPIIQSQ